MKPSNRIIILLAPLFFSTPFNNCYNYKKISLFAQPQSCQATSSRRGPASVALSLISGMQQLGANFNINPSRNSVGDIVIVLSEIDYLRHAITLKQQHKIKLLLAGPNLVFLPHEHNHLIVSPEIDAYFTPSLWVKISYIEDDPRITQRLVIWPAGVDENYWKPTTIKDPTNNHHVLVYQKTNNNQLVQNVQNRLKKYNFQAINIVYGSYNIEQYKQALEQSLFAIVIGNSESQGIALAEAWAMNVPTLVYNLRKYSASGKTFTINSFCPYLTEKTGIDWRELDELEGWIKSMPLCINEFSPRSWVLENMTDVVCTKKLLDLITRL